MTNHKTKPELLAPAGNFEKLEIAIHYGADAVYIAGKNFSLRNFSGNFSEEQLPYAVEFAHKHNVKVYIACNIYSRNRDINLIEQFLKKIESSGADAVIVSDPGIVMSAKKIIPGVDLHLSTQSNTTNINAVKFWETIGIKRVNLARELSLEEIKQITGNCGIETEVFMHGAMCMSYSGRCLLSNFLNDRDSNQGLCSHPCRWQYSVVEQMRPGEYHPVMEDTRGTYIFNSKDLCMINHIPDLINTKISSLKIEGRMKGINYLASVVKTYRNAIDAYISSPDTYEVKKEWIDELMQVYHREYCTGFFFGKISEQSSNLTNIHHGKIHSFIGKIVEKTGEQTYLVEIKNRLTEKDMIEAISPKGSPGTSKIVELSDIEGEKTEKANPNSRALVKLEIDCLPGDILRKL